MYIRIQDNSIRFRVSKAEASQLTEGKTIQSSIALSPTHSLVYGVNTNLSPHFFNFDSKTNRLLLSINREQLQKELEGRPSKQGLLFSQSMTDKSISVSLEIDLKRK